MDEYDVALSHNSGSKLYDELENDIDRLHNDCITLIMATIDSKNHPHVSYTPYAFINGAYYVLIAQLAPHTQHLIDRPYLEILLIDDESKTKNIYARARLTYQVKPEAVEKDTDEYNNALEGLQKRAGKTVRLLSTLNDFKLFKLIPFDGTLVTGFGKAFQITPKKKEETIQLTDKNIKQLRA